MIVKVEHNQSSSSQISNTEKASPARTLSFVIFAVLVGMSLTQKIR